MNTLYTMAGLPASDKSTYTEGHKECVIVSTDIVREELLDSAENQNESAEVFCRSAQKNSASTSRRARGNHRRYERDTQGPQQWTAHEARHVPTDVIDSMTQCMIIPTVDEDFEEVIIL